MFVQIMLITLLICLSYIVSVLIMLITLFIWLSYIMSVQIMLTIYLSGAHLMCTDNADYFIYLAVILCLYR